MPTGTGPVTGRLSLLDSGLFSLVFLSVESCELGVTVRKPFINLHTLIFFSGYNEIFHISQRIRFWPDPGSSDSHKEKKKRSSKSDSNFCINKSIVFVDDHPSQVTVKPDNPPEPKFGTP